MNIDYSLIDRWYKYYIPEYFEPSVLLDFVIKSNTISSFVKNIPLKFDANAPSAYTDGKSCFLAGVYFTPNFYHSLYIGDEKEQVKACIAISNGVQIHEALHVLLLGELNKIDMIHSYEPAEKYANDPIFYDILNIIEDHFSENYCFVKNTKAYKFLELLNDIIFNEKVMSDVVYNVNEKRRVTNILNCLTLFRNRDYLDSSLATECNIVELVDILHKALNIHLEISDRAKIAYEIREWLSQNEDFEQQIQIFSADYENFKQLDTYTILTSEIVQNIIRNKAYELEILQEYFSSVTEDKENPEIPVILKNVAEYSISNKEVTKVREFDDFTHNLKFFSELKRNPGQDVVLGNHFNSRAFYRLNIDGKVMTRNDSNKVRKGQPEIILLIDASGSMSGSLLDMTINVCYTVFEGLKNSDIPVSVYAHTAEFKDALVVAVASHKMPLMTSYVETTYDNQERFKRLHSVENDENADGYAIEFVSKRFNFNSVSDKFLIVLSDGRPNFARYDYMGTKGIEHTKNVVNKLNSDGIYVMSMSLTKGVYDTNNLIYGKERNLEAYGNHLIENMKRTIYNITNKRNN